MFSLLLKLKRLIKKLFKVTSESRQPVRSSRYSQTLIVMFLVLASVLIGLLYPGEELYDPLDTLHKGDIARDAIVAPFEIVVKKTERELESERSAVRNTVPHVVDRDSSVLIAINSELGRLFHLVDSLRAGADSISAGSDVERALVQAISEKFPRLSDKVVTQSLLIDSLSTVGAILTRLLNEEIYPIGVVADANAIPSTGSKYVLIRQGQRENIYARNRIFNVAIANGRLLTVLNQLALRDSIDVDYYYPLGHAFIRPDLETNMPEYLNRLNAELDNISVVSEVVNLGDTIVRAFGKVDQRQARILREKNQIERSVAAQSGWLMASLPALTRVVLVLATLSVLYLFLYFFRREIYYSNPKLLALLLVFALQLFVIHLERTVFSEDISIYLYLVAILPIMVTVLFDAEVGLFSTLVLAILLGLMHRFDFTLSFLTFIVGAVACVTAREVRRRSHFFRIIVYVSLAYGLFILLVESLKMTPQTELLTEIGFGAANGLLTVLLTIGLIPFFESIFGITTDITLLELSDMNHPLLKRLALEAPGTYHHSIIVGNLAETAAKAIGGNPLLARVGCLYHDIGKVEVPEYFVENQLAIRSKHDDLAPTMSSVILASHVKKGRTLGEEADLPDDVLNFIEEHHGTMVMSYFYNKALEQDGDEVSIDKFRYPGPKPQIRETAIAMLADAVEAASRTLDDPKPARINSLIQRIINDRFQSGELNDCPITLRDLAAIKDAFAQVLIGAFHQRITYPRKTSQEEIEET